jgi:histone H3/H4
MRSIEKAEEKRRKGNSKASDVPRVKTGESKKKKSKDTALMVIADGSGQEKTEKRYTRKDFNGIQKRSIREMAYSEDVARLSEDSYSHIAPDLLSFEKRLGDVTGVIARYGKRCTVSPSDVNLALKFMGKSMYF